MKLNCHTLSLSAAIASSIFFTLCAIGMTIWPYQSLDLMAALCMLSSFGPLTDYFMVNGTIYVKGLVQAALYSYGYVYIFCYAYNYLISRR